MSRTYDSSDNHKDSVSMRKKGRSVFIVAGILSILLLCVTGTSSLAASPADASAPYVLYLPVVQKGNPNTFNLSAEVDFIDVGQGDSILITTSDGKTALIDGGEANSGALQYLQSRNISNLDLMIATHPHSDHIGGLIAILNTLPVARIVTNGQSYTTLTYEHFLDAIANAHAVYVEAKRGDTITFGTLTFQVFNPVSVTGDLNSNSLVLLLPINQVTFLFMGDADKAAEATIIAAGLPLDADILKVGHHGSSSSSGPAFLALVSPAVAVYCAGIGNSYGHPSPVTITALHNVGAQVYGTDINGTIAITTDGITYTVRTTK
jgi:competence protein ComEC